MFALRSTAAAPRLIAAAASRRSSPATTRRGFAGADVPVPQSAKAKFGEGHTKGREGWESTIAWFYPTSFLMIAWIHLFEPDNDIRAFAQAEARARLELKKQGFTDFQFGKHYQSLSDDELKQEWETFSAKALRMNDDDDDDEEEDEEDDDDDE